MCWKAVFWVLVISSPAWAISAQRLPGESFEAARERHMPQTWAPAAVATPSAESVAVSWRKLDTTTVNKIAKAEEMYDYIRDLPFLPGKGFDRRVSWLYPHDGCWVRASLARRLAKKEAYGDLKKIFIFGNLNVKTQNAYSGSVSWWYHVVPIYKDSTGRVLVLDPAIDPMGAMDLKAWVASMVGSPEDATYAICSPATYGPNDPCNQKNDKADEDAELDLEPYLENEWDNLELLHRDPEKELGEEPPWRSKPVPVPIPVPQPIVD